MSSKYDILTFLRSMKQHTNYFSFLLLQLLFFTFNLATVATAQYHNVKFERYSTDNGLPSNEVFQVYQDRKGFIWIATRDGLARFDGYTFHTFRNNPQDTTSLSSNVVQYIYEDKEGNLWIGTDVDLHRYDHATQTFARIRTYYKCKENEIYEKNANGEISHNDVNGIYEDKNGKLWITTNGEGLAVLDKKTMKFKYYLRHIQSTTCLQSNYVKALREDHEGTFWIATDAGLAVLKASNQQQGTFITYQFDENNKNGIPSRYIKSVAIDEESTIWIGSDGGVTRLTLANRAAGKFETFNHNPQNPYSLSNNYVKHISIDRKGNLWTCADAGVSRLSVANRKNAIFENFYHDSADPTTIISTYTKYVFEDRFGQIWVACHGGLSKFDPQRERFELYQQKIRQAQPLPSNNIRAFCQRADGSIWIGTNNGLAKMQKKANGETDFITYKQNPSSPKSLVNNYVNCVIESKIDNTLWIGTDNGLSVMTKEGEFINYFHDDKVPTSLCKNTINHVFEDSKGTIWIGTWEGISILEKENRKKGIFKNYPPSVFSSTGNGQISEITEDANGIIWATSKSGLLKYDQQKDKFYSYTSQNKSYYLTTNELNTILPVSATTFWVGTAGAGLYYFDSKAEKFYQFTEEDGLPSNFVEGILLDKNGFVWLTTQKGISRFTPPKTFGTTDKGSFRNFAMQDGLQGNEFLQRAILTDNQGKFYAGGTNGFTAFFPENIKEETTEIPIYITDFKLFNKSVKVGIGSSYLLNQAISETKELNLSYLDNFFSFDFTALTFRNTEKNKFAYKMEEFDKDWIYVDATKRFATYTNLSAGDYVFKVKAANSAGQWNDSGVTLKIRIHPPIWERWWFRGGAVALFFLAVWAFYRYRVHQIEARRQELEVQVKQRTAELVDKNKELEQQKAAIAQQNLQLEEQKHEIIVQNEELHQQQEEILAQRDHITEKNKILEHQKAEIEKSYNNITVLSEIGQKITSSLEVATLISTVYENVNTLMYASAFGIGVYDEERQIVSYTGFVERGEVLPYHEYRMTEEENLTVYCIREKAEVLINDLKTDIYTIFPSYSINLENVIGDVPDSLIYLPLLLDNKVVGVITVQSFQRNAYTQNHINILKTLASYIAIALDNSKAYTQIAAANHEIALQNTQIMDSIRYGKTIQEALLPNARDMQEILGDYFVYYQPKDVVSGDFYWVGKAKGAAMVAAVDCTGHGVPGAFMSMIGMSLLHEAVNQQAIDNPAEVLEYINHEIRNALKQDETTNRDGMDICLCKIERNENTAQITFAGAKRHLYYVIDNQCFDLKGSRKNIGGRQKEDKIFTNELITVEKGTMVYLTTDGYADQANKDRDKFGTLQMIEMFRSMATMPSTEQLQIVKKSMQLHQGTTEQRDDMTVLGVRL